MQNDIVTLEDSRAVSYKSKHTLPVLFSSHAPWYLFTQQRWRLMSKQNPAHGIYSSFIHNCQNLEATKIYFSREMNKWTVKYLDKEVLLCIKMKWPIKHLKDMEEP